MSFPELFELVELLDITRPPDPLLSPFLERKESGEQPGADTGESLLEGVQQDIKRVCLKDYGEMSVLVLYCRNGHLFYRLTQRDRPTKLRIVRWFQNCWICDMCLSPDSQRLLVACSHGILKMLPVLPLLTDSYLTNGEWEARDVESLLNIRPYGCPTSIAWWSAHNAKNIGIVGFQKGSIVFVDLDEREVKRVLELGAEHVPRDLQLQQHNNHSATTLIVVTNSNVNFFCQLESADDTLLNTINGGGSKGCGEDHSEYLSRQEFGSSILSRPSSDVEFSPRRIQVPKETQKLCPYRQNHRSYIALFDSLDSKLLLCQDIDLLSQPLLEYALPQRTYDFLLGNNILYTLSSKGEHMYLSVLSAQMCSLLARREEQDIDSALIFQIKLPSQQRVRKLFPLIAQQQAVTGGLESTVFTQCLIVTRYKVFQCRHVLAPEQLFLQLASRESSMRKADKLGITLQLDICALYEQSAESHLQRGNYMLALNFYKLAKTKTAKIAASFSKYDQFDLLIHHLRTELASALCPDIEIKSNIMFKLLIGKLLREPLPESKLELELDVRLFLHTNQHYNESEILKLLLESDLESLAIDMTLVNGIVQEFICLCAKKGRFILQEATINKILFTRFADLLATLCHGSYLQHMQLFSMLLLLLKYPDTASNILPIIKSKLHLFSVSDLLQLAVLFDPSQEYVKHLVLCNQKSRLSSGRGGLQHSASMDSLNQLSLGAWTVTSNSESNVLPPMQTRMEIDLADTSENFTELQPQAYFEMFIETLLWISRKRKMLQIYTQSPLSEELYIQNINKLFSNLTSSHDSERNSCNQVSCGSSHTGYILMNQVFMWTKTHDHLLSPRTFTADDVHPLTVPLLSFLHIKVLEISCGHDYALARTSCGVYAWGDNTYGQLGLGDRHKRQLPTMIEFLSHTPIVALACGDNHSMVIGSNNIVSVFGDNRYGQLGIGRRDPYQTTPIAIALEVPVVEICGGSMHSLMLAPDGSVFAMGDNSYGQLGVEGLDGATEPVRVQILLEYKVLVIASGAHTCVACGRNATQLWVWGKGFGEQEQGDIDSEVQEKPTIALSKMDINLKKGDQLQNLVIGNNHCLLLTKNGLILSWGCNDQGQCGVGTFDYQNDPKVLPINMTGVCFTSVSAYSSMSAAIDSKNRCFVWGKIYPSSIPQMTTPQSSLELENSPTVIISAVDSSTECSNLPALIHDLQPEWNTNFFTESERAAAHELSERIPGFPDFSCLGTLPYGDESLECALRELHKFYSPTRVRRLCQSTNNLMATALLMEMRGDIPGALECRLRHAVETRGDAELAPKVTELVYKHLDSLLNQNQGAHTSRVSFLNQSILLIKSAYKIYTSHSLPLSNLEEVLASRIDGLAYPLYLYTKEFIDICETPPFTLSFCSRITLVTIRLISSGHPDPYSVLSANNNIPIARSFNEETIWGHVVHNITKDIESSASFEIENNKVKGFFPFPEDDHMVIFSCEHSYTGVEFNNTVVPKFENLLNKNLPNLGKQTIHRIVQHYRNETKFSIGCPACVFINLQRIGSS